MNDKRELEPQNDTDLINKRFRKGVDADIPVLKESRVMDERTIDDLIGVSTSIYQGVSFQKNHGINSWRLSCAPLTTTLLFYPTPEAAADALIQLLNPDRANPLPRSLRNCLKQDVTGSYLRRNFDKELPLF